MADLVPLESVLKEADPAGLLGETDVQSLATAVRRALTSWTLKWPKATCPACGQHVCQVPAKARQALVLGVDGLHKAQHIPSRCRHKNCARQGSYVWHNFTVFQRCHREWTLVDKTLPSVIMISPTFGITRGWYMQFSRRLAVHFSSFWGEAKVHWAPAWKKRISFNRFKLRIEEAWFKTRILVRVLQLPSPCADCWDLSATLEKSVERFKPQYDALMRTRRRDQACHRGQQVTGLVLDGHVKAGRRRRCGVPLIHGLWCKPLQAWCLTNCPDTPARKSLLCQHHAEMAQMDEADPIRVQIVDVQRKQPLSQRKTDLLAVRVRQSGTDRLRHHDLRNCTQAWTAAIQQHLCKCAASLPDSAAGIRAAADADGDDQFQGTVFHDDLTLQELKDLTCRTHKHGSTSSNQKTPCRNKNGGLLVACHSNGLILDLTEFHGAASLPQRYCFLARLKETFPSLRVVVHDDACHLRQFADNRATWNSMAASLAFPNVRYIVDKFHARGHVDEWCRLNCHPGLEENKACVEEINTSICEITFSWLARFKQMTRKMNRFTYWFFVQEVVDERNCQTLDSCAPHNAAVQFPPPTRSQQESDSEAESVSDSATETGSEHDSSSSETGSAA
ncbi:unnamed protein product [Symbiodinium sp. CCMP2592]|nr:unnamed protein product [Symbiodinium sp. CCMP2592]